MTDKPIFTTTVGDLARFLERVAMFTSPSRVRLPLLENIKVIVSTDDGTVAGMASDRYRLIYRYMEHPVVQADADMEFLLSSTSIKTLLAAFGSAAKRRKSDYAAVVCMTEEEDAIVVAFVDSNGVEKVLTLPMETGDYPQVQHLLMEKHLQMSCLIR